MLGDLRSQWVDVGDLFTAPECFFWSKFSKVSGCDLVVFGWLVLWR